ELIKRISDEKLLAHENSRLEEKHNDFRLLINEYHDGILLFELTDEMVWSKAVKDTLGIVEYHASNTDLFMWDERADISAYICENNDVAKKVEKTILDGGNVLDLRKSMLAESPLAIKVEEGLFPREVNTWGDYVFGLRDSNSLEIKERMPNVITYAIESDSFVVIDVRGFVPPTAKSLEEARGQVIASYQDYLEKQWVEELRSKYTVEINEEVLYELIN
ncbi:MAG: hypothetical protein VX548_06200, partial [Bacteroidota bacterium]|nr:hypothetical protein [Bacteroidota bacterium]